MTTVPSEDVTETVARVFAAVLQTESPAPDDDFFEAGGDSMAAIEIVSTLEEELGVSVGVEEIFDFSTPARLAARVAELRTNA
jgi:acyl carrier protein